MSDDLHPVVGAIAAVTAIVSGVFGSVVTWTAFRGGTVPLVGWEFEGGVVAGTVAFMVGFPLITMAGYLIGGVVAWPLQWLLTRSDKQ